VVVVVVVRVAYEVEVSVKVLVAVTVTYCAKFAVSTIGPFMVTPEGLLDPV
jgi:hypothetical protein